jgi:hypothetical protein
MRKFLLALLVCEIGILSGAAHAQDKLMIADRPDLPRAMHISGEEALAIGAGIVIGAAAGYSLPFPAATLIGGVAGGLVSHWWYNHEADDYEPLPRRN